MSEVMRDAASSRRSASRTRSARRERGAAAVEMAIIFPLLLIMLGGIVDLGRYMFTKEIVTNAAREGARMIAVGYSQTQADARVAQALAGGTVATAAYTYSNAAGNCPTSPTATDSVTVTVSTPAAGQPGQFQYLILGPASRMFGTTALSAPVLTGTSSMRCGG